MQSSVKIKKTPLYEKHIALGARMVPFAGFEMPIQYTGIIDEHVAVRKTAGLFDVSHMGEFMVRGPQAFDFVQHLVTNDAGSLYDGRAMYSVMCLPDGGIVDDLLVYRLAGDAYMLVVNASNIDKDFEWIQSHNPMGAELENISDQTALLAVQGPASFEIVQKIMDYPLQNLKYYHFVQLPNGSFFSCRFAILSHTGYTGEPGLEIYCDAAHAGEVWDALMTAGEPLELKPAGLGARDTLRLEAGFSLYGNDITEETTPLEAGLGWITKLDKGDFIGREALLKQKVEGPKRKLVGFILEERGVPRAGYPIVDTSGREIGVVTSGTQSPVLSQGIGLGYVENDPAFTSTGAGVAVSVRGRPLPARVARPPFHK